MTCESNKTEMIGYLTGELDDHSRKQVEEHLAACSACREELDALREVWGLLAIPPPEPSPALHSRFGQMLDSFRDEQRPSLLQRWGQKWSAAFRKPYLAPVFGAGGLALGVAIGLYLTRPTQREAAPSKDVQALAAQVQELKQVTLLTLLESASASDRIKAVSYTSGLSNVNKSVATALLATLNSDPNVNVRLVALEALDRYADDPQVREGLIQSIPQQESPLVQSAIADEMVKLGDKRSVAPLRGLLRKKDLNGAIKMKIEKSINRLI